MRPPPLPPPSAAASAAAAFRPPARPGEVKPLKGTPSSRKAKQQKPWQRPEFLSHDPAKDGGGGGARGGGGGGEAGAAAEAKRATTSAAVARPDEVEWRCWGCRKSNRTPGVAWYITECDECGQVACGDCALEGFPDCGHLPD